MLTKSKRASLMAMLVVSLMVGNSFVAMAGVPAPPPVAPGTTTYVDGNWNVNTAVTYTNQGIVLTGNLTIQSGGSLTLVNSDLLMNCTYDGEYHIEILSGGSLILDDTDGFIYNDPANTDGSLISTLGAAYNTYLWARAGSTFTATNARISNIGVVGAAYLNGGAAPETDLADWLAIGNGTFRVSIDGVARNIWGLNFAGIDGAPSVGADVAAVVGVALVGAGYTGVTCTWTGTNFVITSGSWVDGVYVRTSSVAKLTTVTSGVAADISGTVASPGAFYLDMAANARENYRDSSRTGSYFQTGNVNIVGCSIEDSANGLFFDSVFPASLTDTSVSNLDNYGVAVANVTTESWACAGTLADFEVHDANENGVIVYARTIDIEVNNVNLSSNDYGLAVLADTLADAYVHDSEFYFNHRMDYDYSAIMIIAEGWESTTNATIEDNILFENDCYGIWAGYRYSGIYSNHTNVQLNNNILIGNHYGEIFHAVEDLYVHAEGNFFGASENTGYGDGLKIGTTHGIECDDDWDFTENVTFELIDNEFNYDYGMSAYTNYREITGVVRTGALWSMDATAIGNTVIGTDYIAYGGIFMIGTPTPSFNEWLRPRYLTAYFEDNDVSTLYSSTESYIGGVYVFSAVEDADVTMINNKYYSNQGSTGGIIEVQGGSPDYGLVLKNCTVLLRGNEIFADPSLSTGSGGIGGFVRILGIGWVDVTIDDNSFKFQDYNGAANLGGVIRIGRHGDDYNGPQEEITAVITNNLIDIGLENSYDVGGVLRITPYKEMDVTITGNQVYLNHWESYIGGIFWIGMQGGDEDLPSALNVTLTVEYNEVTYRSFSDNNEGELGGIVRAYARNNMDVTINYNTFSVFGYYSNSINGIIWIGKKGEVDTAFNLTIEIIGNDIDVSAQQDTNVNGIMRIYAYELIDADISNNDISVDYDTGDLGGVIWVGDWGNESSTSTIYDEIDGYARFDLETYLNFCNNNIYVDAPFDHGNTGGMLRIIGREVTDVTMNDNVIQASFMPAPQTMGDEDDMYDLGVRIGKHNFCLDSQSLYSNHTTVRMLNNIIGPGGKAAALLIAGYHVTATIEGGSVQGAIYDDYIYHAGDYFMGDYGNGIVLLSKNTMTATITDVEIFDNRGVGVYAEATGTAILNMNDCTITDNDFGGVILKGVTGGIIDNCYVIGNGFDTWGRYTFYQESGMRFEGTTMLIRNSTIFNPDAIYELLPLANSHITTLNTIFDKDDVRLEGSPATLRSGLDFQDEYRYWWGCQLGWLNQNRWHTIADGTFRISIDGFAADIGPIDFTVMGGSNENNDVAQLIQDAIRAEPGAPDGYLNATVVWDDAFGFKIMSGTNGTASTISKLSAHSGALGTDISGNVVSTPAYRTGGTHHLSNCQSGGNYANWATINNGTFRLTIGGYSADVGPVNFTGSSSRNDVATRIQTAIRAVAGAPVSFTNAVVVYSYNYNEVTNYGERTFYILSGATDPSLEIMPLQTHSGGLGTDISGNKLDPWGSAWLDMAANGTSVKAKAWLDMTGTDSVAVQGTDTTSLLVQWYLDVRTVRASNGGSIPGSLVEVRDLGNSIVGTALTGFDGWARNIVTNEYLQTTSTKTYYTPHAVLAIRGNATGSAAPTMDASKGVVITLDFTPPLPVADAGEDQEVLGGFNATFNGTGSTADTWLMYTWTFNNGTANITLSGNIATYNCSVQAILPGTYTVMLTVVDWWGQTANDTTLLTVIDPNPPIADAGPDQTVNEDAVMRFNGTASFDVTNYTWSFMDGAASVLLYGVTPSYTFAQPGIYVATLTTEDVDGNTDTDTVTITVLDITAPVADAGVDISIPEGGIAHFVGTASTDNVAVVAYEWTFTDAGNVITLTGATPNYTFLNIGSYDVTLTAFDAVGNTDTDHVLVTVLDVTAPAVLVVAPGESLEEVPLNWSLVIVFTEPMNQTSVEEAFSITGFTGTITFTWDPTGRYVQVTFQGGLEFETDYAFTIGTNATDLEGNNLAAAKTGTFTTLAAPEEVPEPETNFFTDNWWILVVIIVVLAVLLLVSLLRGKKDPDAAPAGAPPAPPEEPPVEQAPVEPAPEELPPEEP